MSVPTITPAALFAKIQSGAKVEILDVRTPVEHREVHAQGAVCAPLDVLDPKALMAGRNGSADQPLYVICRSGQRAAKACDKFVAAGFNNVVLIDGGTQAWEQAGLPVVRGQKSMSLERQVRIAAGLIVLLGIGLAHWVHPYFVYLSAFVGAGLVFAGVTDTCGMGMMLAKMPWNKVSAPTPTAAAPAQTTPASSTPAAVAGEACAPKSEGSTGSSCCH